MIDLKCYINGTFVALYEASTFNVINPATEEVIANLPLGSEKEVDMAVEAARRAFKTFQFSPKEERINLLEKFIDAYGKRVDDIAVAVTTEMGCPDWLSKEAQALAPLEQTKILLEVLKSNSFEKDYKISKVKRVPIGVCGLITPWNWPIAVTIPKIIPAIAVGCTVVWKPSVYAPLCAQVLAEIMDEINLPKGVFNMIYGRGGIVGKAISSHPDIDCVTFTGSTRAGIDIAERAAKTLKRVAQELGGKSPNIILPSADIVEKTKLAIKGLMINSGQTCSAPSRLIVQNSKMEEVKNTILEMEKEITVGSPKGDVFIGPVVNKTQYERVQGFIQSGIEEGATLLIGGPGKPDGLEVGYYVKPTIFINTTPDMKIVKEEIFGPVLVVQGYDTVEEAIELACDTKYGLAAYIQGKDLEEIKSVADRIPAGQVCFNDANFELFDPYAPFGGFKQSGNGRECGELGFDEFLEYKALIGYFAQ